MACSALCSIEQGCAQFVQALGALELATGQRIRFHLQLAFTLACLLQLLGSDETDSRNCKIRASACSMRVAICCLGPTSMLSALATAC